MGNLATVDSQMHTLPFKVQVVATAQDGSPHTADVLLGSVHCEAVESLQSQVLLLWN